jgi:exopolyphosphatase/guanosine-5'-triphosphate,3'-diphosphate pyrophosphatase
LSTPIRLVLPSKSPPLPAGAASRRGAAGTRIAAIDIGSNSIRQLIADVSAEGAITVVDEMKAAPRLGAGLDATGELAEASIRRAIDALASMATLARQVGAQRIEVVATSAVRDASNADQFLARVKQETGLAVRVLSGNEEALLSFRSAMAHFDIGVGRTAVVDIGGGSLEVALSAGGILDQLMSLPLGAVRLTEAFLAKGTTPRAVKKLRREVREQLRAIPVRDWRGVRVIGSGGTFTNLAGMVLARQGLSIARTVHGTTIARSEVKHVLAELVEMSDEERRTVPGLNAGRADIIVAGLAVLAELLSRLEAREVLVSRYGIREGLLLEVARVTPAAADPGEARERSIREFAERCQLEWPHAEQVRRLALRLFDQIGARLGCTPEDRLTLADAALVHDIGYHINYERHHKHSYHLVMHAELLGLSPEEQIVIANVARYHRGAVPKRRQGNFGALDKTLRRRIRRLAAILRIADGLDRGHVGAVKDVRVRWLKRALRISPVPARANRMRLELLGAHNKSGMLAKAAGIPVEIVAPDGKVLSSDHFDESVDLSRS